jgi:hypothetical protein
MIKEKNPIKTDKNSLLIDFFKNWLMFCSYTFTAESHLPAGRQGGHRGKGF